MSTDIKGSAPELEQLEYFSLLPDRAEFRPAGNVSLLQAVDMVTNAMKHARAHNQGRLLVDISHLTGFKPPTVADRYFIVRKWAEVARGHVRLALVARQEIIDPQRFGVTVAENAGWTANIFTSELEALEWLRDRQ